MRRLRLLRPHVALLGCLCALLFLGSTNAYAHTSLTEAAPGPGATVGPGAEVVSLTFGPLKSGTTPTIGLIGPDGTDVPVGEPVVADGSVVCAAVTSLPTGVNTLNYTVISADGDTQSSAFQFEVADGARTVTAPSVCQHLGLSAAGRGRECRGRHVPGARPHHGHGRPRGDGRRHRGLGRPRCAHAAQIADDERGKGHGVTPTRTEPRARSPDMPDHGDNSLGRRRTNRRRATQQKGPARRTAGPGLRSADHARALAALSLDHDRRLSRR